jgi:iron complex outermembrane receptor protein
MQVARRSGKLFNGLSRSALIVCSLAMPMLAAANEGNEAEDGRSDTVVITGVNTQGTGSGTKTDTPLMETPQSITVIDGEELTLRNAQSINQALGYVAGVSPNQRGGMVTRYDQLILRGFAPGVYQDGMRLIAGPYSTPQIDFNRVERIDIVKGPASVLYGNSTPGGLVNLVSKMPEATEFGRVELQAGNYDTLRAVADINQPLDSQGRLLFRVVGGWQKNDGLTRGTFSERYHVSPMLTFAPTDRTSLTLIATYQRSPSGGGYSGVPAYGSVLTNPLGEFSRDINTGDPAYERYDHKQKAIAAFFRHEFDDSLSFRSNFRFQNNQLSYRQLYVAGFATTGNGANRNSDFSTIIRGQRIGRGFRYADARQPFRGEVRDWATPAQCTARHRLSEHHRREFSAVQHRGFHEPADQHPEPQSVQARLWRHDAQF